MMKKKRNFLIFTVADLQLLTVVLLSMVTVVIQPAVLVSVVHDTASTNI